MNNDTNSFYNYKLFLKKNYKLIIGSAIVIVLLAVVSSIIFYTTDEEESIGETEHVVNEILPELETSQDVNALTADQTELVTDYLNRESYAFRFYVENDDNTTFTNNQLLKELLVDEELLQIMEEQTDSEFLIPEELGLSVATVSGPNMIQVTARTGNEDYNRKIANFYYQYISNGNISLFDDKTMYFIESEPIPYQEMYEVEEVEEEQPSFYDNLVSNLEVLIIVAVLGTFLGLIFGIILSIIREIISPKISSIYNFDIYNEVELIDLDSIKLESETNVDNIITQAIMSDGKQNTLVLSESPLSESISNQLITSTDNNINKDHLNVKNIEMISLNKVGEFVVMIQIYETSKEWFEKQMEQVKILKVPVKIIRLPIDYKSFEKE